MPEQKASAPLHSELEEDLNPAFFAASPAVRNLIAVAFVAETETWVAAVVTDAGIVDLGTAVRAKKTVVFAAAVALHSSV